MQVQCYSYNSSKVVETQLHWRRDSEWMNIRRNCDARCASRRVRLDGSKAHGTPWVNYSVGSSAGGRRETKDMHQHSPFVKKTLDGVMFHPPYLLI